MSCGECGKELEIGEWPFCPHGKDVTFGHPPFKEYYCDQRGMFLKSREQRQSFDRQRKIEQLSKYETLRIMENPATTPERIRERWKEF